VAKQPAPEPVPDDEVPERLVADPKRQEVGERPWQESLFASMAERLNALAEKWVPLLGAFARPGE